MAAFAQHGVLLRGRRASAGLTQEDLASRSGLSVRAISDLERGRTSRPRRQSVRLIADALGLSGEARDELFSSAGYDPLPGETGRPRDANGQADAGHRSPRAAAAWAVPRQLPRAIRHFAGRAGALRALGAQAAQGAVPGGMAAVAVISGAAGAGKTSLAVHWAHQVAGQFPGGQLYVNLRGYDPSGTAVTAEAAVGGFLGALGVPAVSWPAGPDARAALYRSLLAGRRVLVVLDNALDAAQVRPLLPGSGPSMAVITSRSRLPGLAVTDGAHAIGLGMLSPAEAGELLGRHLSAACLARDRDAAAELTAVCGGLPLALAIVAGPAAATPAVPLTELAAELRDAGNRLDALATLDEATDVRAVLSWSWRHLSGAAARVCRLLALHPGAGISASAAASMAGLSLPQARPVLRELTSACLLTEDAPGRFAFHDLLRLHAGEQARLLDSETVRRVAVHRLLDHYLHTGYQAALLLEPARRPLALPPARPGVSPQNLPDRRRALDWLEAERPALLSAASTAAAAGLDVHAWQIPWAMAGFLQYCGYWPDYVWSQGVALAATRRLGDLAGQARTHYNLGLALGMTGAHQEARGHFERSLAIRGQLGDPAGAGRTQAALGWTAERQGRYQDAARHAREALGLYQAAGDRLGQQEALGATGWYQALLGDYEKALESCQLALLLKDEPGVTNAEAQVLDTIGYAQHHLGRHGKAISSYGQALAIYRQRTGVNEVTVVLRHLGDVHDAAGNTALALAAWQEALDLLEELRHPDAAKLRARIKERSERPELLDRASP